MSHQCIILHVFVLCPGRIPCQFRLSSCQDRYKDFAPINRQGTKHQVHLQQRCSASRNGQCMCLVVDHDAAAGDDLLAPFCWLRCGNVVGHGIQGRTLGGTEGQVDEPAPITTALIQTLVTACQAGTVPVASKGRSWKNATLTAAHTTLQR